MVVVVAGDREGRKVVEEQKPDEERSRIRNLKKTLAEKTGDEDRRERVVPERCGEIGPELFGVHACGDTRGQYQNEKVLILREGGRGSNLPLHRYRQRGSA